MRSHRSFVIVLIPMLGCIQQTEPVPQQAPALAPVMTSQPEAAKAHVQQFIDRLMGGDQSVKAGLLGMDGVDFNTIESIQITSAVPTYLPEGKQVRNMVHVIMKVRGYDALRKRTIEKNIEQDLFLKDGKWSLLGSEL